MVVVVVGGCGDLGVCSGGWESPSEKYGGLEPTGWTGAPSWCELHNLETHSDE